MTEDVPGIEWRNGLPVKIESFTPMDKKRRYGIVRRDNCASVPGDIVSANVVTGECALVVVDKSEDKSFGPDGFRIIRR
jgi:hypothetical protein